jgi:hypothetical protein
MEADNADLRFEAKNAILESIRLKKSDLRADYFLRSIRNATRKVALDSS